MTHGKHPAGFFDCDSGAQDHTLASSLNIGSIKCVYTRRNDELEDVSPFKQWPFWVSSPSNSGVI